MITSEKIFIEYSIALVTQSIFSLSKWTRITILLDACQVCLSLLILNIKRVIAITWNLFILLITLIKELQNTSFLFL